MVGCWWSHKWGKWQDMERGNTLLRKRIAGYLVNEMVDGSYITQERRCERCGTVERQTLTFAELEKERPC